ncbi:MAG TPA: YdcH family protein [Alphaproteobacteria bacterium]|nr:YdcH family protein [Alphaproteobacteria bacterium]
MTTESHIAALERRHRELDQQIEEEMAHISHDDLYVAALKRKKLEIKDELARLSRSNEPA